ncbi:hypothetical protein GCM10010404_27680 [Nonomuraea africana]
MGIDGLYLIRDQALLLGGLRPQVGLIDTEEIGDGPPMPRVGKPPFEPAVNGLGINREACGHVSGLQAGVDEGVAKVVVHTAHLRGRPVLIANVTQDVPRRPRFVV